MNTNRSAKIVEYLTERRSASVSELSRAFKVSEMTIRRDLAQLEKLDQVTRFHGGATINTQEIRNDLFANRLSLNRGLKVKIGAACDDYANAHIKRNDSASVFIASGSTMYYFAKQLEIPSSVNVITDNIHAAGLLMSKNRYPVIMIGGQMLLPSGNAVGFMAEKMIAGFSIDLAFIGAPAIDEAGNIYVFNLLEAGTVSTIISAARHIVLALDHTKFEKKNLMKLCKIDSSFTLITDREAPRDTLREFAEMGIEIITV